MIRRLSSIVLALCVLHGSMAQFYNGSEQRFGKSRVQYQDFLWQYYRFDRLETYFYKGGRDLARYTALSAHKQMKELEKEFDFAIDDRLQFIVYNSLTDFRQSNIGGTGDEEQNIGGVTRIVGTKIFLYYEGDHALLDLQIRTGIAQVLLDQMMYGGNWREVFKNSTLLNLPEWYDKGVVAWTAGPWDAETANRIRDGVLTGRFDRINRLQGEEAALAGRAIWSYVADVYGSSVIPNILYMTRVSRSAESGFLFVLGVSLKTLTEECLDHYRGRFTLEDQGRDEPTLEELPVRTRKKRTYAQFEVSPDGRYAAWVSNELGQYKVWLYERATGRVKRLVKGEVKLNRIVDRSFPALAWHPGSRALTFTVERKGELYLKTYTLDDRKITTRPVFMLEKILDLSYSPDGQNMVFSGVREGRTDLYLYYMIGNRQEQLTDDQFDDLQPRFTSDGRGILFSSDRDSDTLRTISGSGGDIGLVNGTKDILLYDLVSRSPVLTRLTRTPGVNETAPAQLDSAAYVCLSDEGGVRDRWSIRYDSVISQIDTAIHYRYFSVTRRMSSLKRSILEQEVDALHGRYTQLMYSKGKYRFLIGRIGEDRTVQRPADGRPAAARADSTATGNEVDMGRVVKVDPDRPPPTTDAIDIDNYVFSDEATSPQGVPPPPGALVAKADTAAARDTLARAAPPLKFPEQRNYNVNFATEQVLTQIDNSYNDGFYQPFTGPANLNPGISGLMKMSITDLMEDYRIVGGFRLALDLNNNDYLFTYSSLRQRMDKSVTIQRQALQGVSEFGVVKLVTNLVQGQLSWPFNELTTLRGSVIYRHDRYVLQSTDLISLREPNFNDQNTGIKLEYIYDTSIPRGLNLWTGWKAKVFAEAYVNPEQAYTTDVRGTDMQVVGFDIRNSQTVHRDIIWVNRLAYGTSLGSRKVIHFLGGVDNWMFPKVDNGMPIDFSQNYYYQTLGSPLRGFFYNARNGNSFAVFNTELRIPLFRYLMNRPIRSDFFQNFQLIGFSDVGSAWTGSGPYSEDNSFNTQVIYNNPLTITIKNQREPIIYSYGFGARSRLLGYYMRADWAWGVDDGIVLPMVFHFSLSVDI